MIPKRVAQPRGHGAHLVDARVVVAPERAARPARHLIGIVARAHGY